MDLYNEQILFLQRTLNRIKTLKEDNENIVVLNNLLYEIHNYTDRTWSKELHEVFINIVYYSFKIDRAICGDLEYYNVICKKDSNTDKVIELFKYLTDMSTEFVRSTNDYFIIEKKHRYVEENYKFIYESNFTFINQITLLFYEYCHKNKLRRTFIDNLGLFLNSKNKDLEIYLKILDICIDFKIFNTIIRCINDIEKNIDSYELELLEKYYDIISNFSLNIEDFMLHTLFLIRKQENIDKIIFSYLSINEYTLKNRIFIKSIDNSKEKLLQQILLYNNKSEHILKNLKHTDYKDNIYKKFVSKTMLYNFIKMTMLNYNIKLEFFDVVDDYNITFSRNINLVLEEFKNNPIKLKSIIPEETEEEREEKYKQAELSRIKSLDDVRDRQEEYQKTIQKDKEVENLKVHIKDKLGLSKRKSEEFKDKDSKEDLVKAAQEIYDAQILDNKNKKLREWNDYNRYIKVLRIIELENLENYEKLKLVNVEESIENKKIEHKKEWERIKNIKGRLVKINKYI